MSYKLETANCTPQYLSKKKIVVFVRLELMTFTLKHDTLLTRLCWTHSIWYS